MARAEEEAAQREAATPEAEDVLTLAKGRCHAQDAGYWWRPRTPAGAAALTPEPERLGSDRGAGQGRATRAGGPRRQPAR